MPEKISTTSKLACEEPNVVQVHVVLEDITPQIWRRVIVPLNITLAKFHLILQAANGWTDSYLHEFDIGGLRYGDVDEDNIFSIEGVVQSSIFRCSL